MFERADCLSGTGFLGDGDSLSDFPLFGERIFVRKDCFFSYGCVLADLKMLGGLGRSGQYLYIIC